MVYRNAQVVGKRNRPTKESSIGIYSPNDIYKEKLHDSFPEVFQVYNTGYMPRYHDSSSTVGDTIDKSTGNGMQAATASLTMLANLHPTSSDTGQVGYYFSDLGTDIFDSWGYFNIYRPDTQNQFTIPFDSINQADGEANMTTTTFNGDGKTWLVKHGFPDQGIWVMHIQNRTDDTSTYQLLMGGNVGSDNSTNVRNTTVDGTLNSPSETIRIPIFQNSDNSSYNSNEQYQLAIIPNKVSEFGSGTSTTNIIEHNQTGTSDNYQIKTTAISGAVTLYLGKGNHLSNFGAYVAADLNKTT